jgi:glyoxylase-like metal-dependent hydrolase (beta-lactamase superfamily II)
MAVPAGRSTLRVGDILVHFLPDGSGAFVREVMFPTSTPEAWKLHPQYLDDRDRVVASVGSFLVQRGDQNLLVDTGAGVLDMDVEGFASLHSGRLLESLAAAGVRPEDVQRVVFTHLHSDHIGWTVRPEGGGPVFPRATHLVGRGEREYWAGKTDGFAPPPPVQEFLGSSAVAVADGEELMPGVTVVETPGHTPGHICLVVASGTERAMILGDVVHCPVQLEEADWAMFADVDPKAAKETRDRLWAELEGSPTVAAGGHMSDNVFGRIARGQGKRQWLMQEGLTQGG